MVKMVHQRTVPIAIEAEEDDQYYWQRKRVRTHQHRGNVVTDTVTEYREEEYDPPGSASLPIISKGVSDDAGAKSRFQDAFFKHDGRARDEEKARAVSSSSSGDDDEAAAGSTSQEFAREVLDLHNKHRKKHQAQPLVLSKKLCAYAQEWADTLAREDRFDHRHNSPYGENLFCVWSSNKKAEVPGSAPVESWYSECGRHRYGQPSGGGGSGHFSQMVWRDSARLGVAAARDREGKVVVVANYDPPGNVLGRYAENVLPPRG